MHTNEARLFDDRSSGVNKSKEMMMTNGRGDDKYFLELFGSCPLPYFPDKIGVFSGSNAMTYLLMTVENELIVLLIQAVLKKPTNRMISKQAIPSLVSNRYGNLLPPITPRIKPAKPIKTP